VSCVIVFLALLVVYFVLTPLLVFADVSLVWRGVVVGVLSLSAVVVGLSWEILVAVVVARPWWLAGSPIVVGEPASWLWSGCRNWPICCLTCVVRVLVPALRMYKRAPSSGGAVWCLSGACVSHCHSCL
jgi:hypothetical protein